MDSGVGVSWATAAEEAEMLNVLPLFNWHEFKEEGLGILREIHNFWLGNEDGEEGFKLEKQLTVGWIVVVNIFQKVREIIREIVYI